jgi:hypothetical protein
MNMVGWLLALAFISAGLGAMAHWIFSKDSCGKCGIIELKAEIKRQSVLIRALAEKVGISVPEQTEMVRGEL